MIGKTRQPAEERFDAAVGEARGVLRSRPTAGRIRHTRRAPKAELAPWIAHYWTVSWDLRDCPPHIAETLPHPNVHLVFEEKRITVNGVHTRKFSTVLKGRSQVSAVKFKPGGFRPFYGKPISELADRSIDATIVFGPAVSALGEVLQTLSREKERIRALNEFFKARLPEPDAAVVLADQLVSAIFRDPDIQTVDTLVRVSGTGKRTLQRLFRDYVGASPKWVIRRYRLHEALERLHTGEPVSFAELAARLSYFDQAHLIKDFKSIVGLTPGQYQAYSREP